MTPAKTDIRNLTPAELETALTEMGEKPYRSAQIRKWLLKLGAWDWDQMTDLSRSLRSRLAERFLLGRPELIEEAQSQDGTRKFLWGLADGLSVESVLIPERDHLTLCVSSQVGCAMGCRFCRTARLGFRRNLTPAEIIDQVLEISRRMPDEGGVKNLVFMGMGEPLANLAGVLQALSILLTPGLRGLSRKHISVSTVGLAPEIPRLAEAGNVGLTVSLGSADDQVRDWLMPVNRRYGLARLHQALADYPLPRGRRITIAYILLAGVNDSPEDALKLSRFVHGLKVKINLIPFNPFPGAEFERPSEEAVEAFRDVLFRKHHTVMVRKSKGTDIAGACGQLAGRRIGEDTAQSDKWQDEPEAGGCGDRDG